MYPAVLFNDPLFSAKVVNDGFTWIHYDGLMHTWTGVCRVV